MASAGRARSHAPQTMTPMTLITHAANAASTNFVITSRVNERGLISSSGISRARALALCLPIRPVDVESSPVRLELAARGEGGPTSLERHRRISAGCRDVQATRSKVSREDVLCLFFAMDEMNLSQAWRLRANPFNPSEQFVPVAVCAIPVQDFNLRAQRNLFAKHPDGGSFFH